MPPKQIRRILNRALRLALKASGKKQIFVELFSGSGTLARQVQIVSGFHCVQFDLAKGPAFNVTDQTVLNMLMGWIGARVIRGVWAGFPCTTWSMARYPPLRSNASPWGLPHQLEVPRSAEQIKVGNATLRAAARVANACLRASTPCVLENPHGAMSWGAPPMRRLQLQPNVEQVVCDYCCFGMPWRKRTRLVGVACSAAPALQRRCTAKRGLCSTGKPHLTLRGTKPGTNVLWTRIAEPYPRKMARAAAQWLVRAADNQQLHFMQSLVI